MIRALVFSLAISLASEAADSSNRADLAPYEAVEPHMGTLFRIKLYARDQATAERAFRAAFDRCACGTPARYSIVTFLPSL